MPYNEQLADRIRETIPLKKGIVEKKMFGGIAFMLKNKMFCGIVKDDLMVRVLEEHYEQAVSEPHARPMDFTGKIMRGFVFVSPGGINSPNKLAIWIEKGIDFAMKAPVRINVVAKRKVTSRKKNAPKKKSAAKKRSR